MNATGYDSAVEVVEPTSNEHAPAYYMTITEANRTDER